MQQCSLWSGPIPEQKGTGRRRKICPDCLLNPPECIVDGCAEHLRSGSIGNGMCRMHEYRQKRGLPFDAPKAKWTRRGPICSAEGCGRPKHAQGWCAGHYRRSKDGRDMEPPLASQDRSKRRFCTVEGCDNRRDSSRHFCQMHYRRFKKYGSPGEAERRKAPPGAAVWDAKEYRRRYNRLRAYGLRPEEFDAMLNSQGGRCAICHTKDPGSKGFVVDHDHSAGHVRGLLCNNCNRAVGLLKDDPAVLKRAREYVLRHRQEQLFGPAGEVKGTA